MVSEGAIFGIDDCTGTDTLVTDAVYETTPGAVAGWGETTVDCGFNYDGNVVLG